MSDLSGISLSPAGSILHRAIKHATRLLHSYNKLVESILGKLRPHGAGT